MNRAMPSNAQTATNDSYCEIPSVRLQRRRDTSRPYRLLRLTAEHGMIHPDPTDYYNRLQKERIDCPICSGKKQQLLFCGDRYGMGVETVGCKRCGMIFINPRPTEKAMLNFYQTEYRRLYEAVEVPTEEYVSAGPFRPRAHYVVNAIDSILENGKGMRFLDIGCGEGTLLQTVKNNHPQVECFGLEPDPNFAAYARSNSGAEDVFCSDFGSFFDGNQQTFHVIALTHVLEHLLDPVATLTRIREILEPGGFFYVEVPNIADPRTSGLGQIHLGHVMSFAPGTLTRALQTAGFEVTKFFSGDLPAKTPAMAALCRPGSMQKRFSFGIRRPAVRRSEINKGFRDFQSAVCGLPAAKESGWLRRLAG